MQLMQADNAEGSANVPLCHSGVDLLAVRRNSTQDLAKRFMYSLSCQISRTFQGTIFSYGQTDGRIGMLSTLHVFISLHEQGSRSKNICRWAPPLPTHQCHAIYSHSESYQLKHGHWDTHNHTYIMILGLTHRQKAAVRPNGITPYGSHKWCSVPTLWQHCRGTCCS